MLSVTRQLRYAVENIQWSLQRQTSAVWQRIKFKAGLRDPQPDDIWGGHSTYFSESGLPQNQDEEDYVEDEDGSWQQGEMNGQDAVGGSSLVLLKLCYCISLLHYYLYWPCTYY